MSSLREQALAPLSRADAERLLPLLSSGRQTLERRVLRARCLKYFESFDLAWAELNEVLPQVKEPLLEARVAVDLLQLSYYLVRRDETPKLAAIAQKHAAGDPLMLAEFYLGNSTVLTAQNEITSALQSARRAEDALLTAPKGRARDLVVTRVQRQLAHLLSHSGDYVDATAAAEATVRHAARVGDPWEAAWAVYTTGFVDWAAGRIDQAVDQFTKAEASVRTYGSSVWRYTCLCLARARMERGEIADGDRLARQSATGAAEDHAHLALLRGETDVADRILTRAPTGFPEDEQFRNNVRAIVRAEKGDPRGGVRMLDEAAKEFEARGMAHWALGAAVHAAYWRESLVRGGGASRAAGLVRDIGARGGAHAASGGLVANWPNEIERKRLSKEYRTLADGITSILFRMDPVGIAVDNPHTDEYASEAAMIARFLPEAKDTEDLERAVREVFLRQFGEPLLGPITQYRDIALEIWRFTSEVRKAASG